MSVEIRPGAPLAAAGNRLHTEWLSAAAGPPPATAGLGEITGGNGAARWFGAPAAAAWAAAHRIDLPAADRERFDADLVALQRGEAGVVVTGQQPGFLGGPLLTVHKIATAAALAERLTAAGRPTVPVFWSGDDDDDLLEALAPLAWLPGGRLVRSEGYAPARHGRTDRHRLGTLPAARWHTEARSWFAAAGVRDDELELAPLWSGDGDSPPDWARRGRRALLRAFRGCGLLVVSGDDAGLHAAGAEFYAEVAGRRERLADLVGARGRELAAAGGHAQLGARALTRPLYRTDGTRRRPLSAGESAPPAETRPGVMLRSPLQDWLLDPRAVVVGPGELAYLRQLEPLYAELGLPRSPLVPRLGCWLLPPDFPGERLTAHRRATAPIGSGDAAAVAAWLDRARGSLAELLRAAAEVDAGRADQLADRRVSRWARGLHGVVRGERSRLRASGPRTPSWVFPLGDRQERALAWVPVLALGGRVLRDGILAAARQHLTSGAAGDWREMECVHDEPQIT